jgi:hypothetical protein
MAATGVIRAEELERRDRALAVLSIIVISVLAIGLLLLRFPEVFGRKEGIPAATLQDYFFGFFAVVLLFNVYLIFRQAALRNLRKALMQEQSRNLALALQAGQELLAGLPRLEAFEDALAMEFRRSSAASAPLTVMRIHVLPSAHILERNVQGAAFADSAKAVIARFSKKGSIFNCGDGLFATLLPGMNHDEALAAKQQMEETLTDVSGVTDRFRHDIKAATFPQDVQSMHELKTLVTAK